MTGEFTKPTALVAAQVGQLAKSDDYNKNLALLAKDSFIPVDVDGSPADGDLGDETIGTNGTLIEDLKVRTGKALKIYDASGTFSSSVDWTTLVGLENYTITSFADLSSGSYTTGDYHIATVTTGIFTSNYIYLKITTGSGWSEIIPYSGQTLLLETDQALYYYNSTGWHKSADSRASLASNGYTYLPNDIVMQWGKDAAFRNSASTQAITFPITFPNAVFSIATGCEADTVAYYAAAVSFSSITTSGFTAIYDEWAAIPQNIKINYIAMGN